jgi:hypothetical protein
MLSIKCECLEYKWRLSILGAIASFDNFSPHTTHHGRGLSESLVQENPIFK